VEATKEQAAAAPADEGDRAVALVGVAPLDRLEEVVRALKQRIAPEAVRKAMVERIARAPYAEFETLKHIYLKHCGDAAW
jgi:hypothetical protein